MKIFIHAFFTLIFFSMPAFAQDQVYLRADARASLIPGQELNVRPTDSTVYVNSTYGNREQLTYLAELPDGRKLRLEITSPEGERLTARSYDYVRSIRDELPGHGGLAITIVHSTWTDLLARVNVLEIERGADGHIISIAVDFQLAGKDFLSLRGRAKFSGAIRKNSLRPVHLPISIPSVPFAGDHGESEFVIENDDRTFARLNNADGAFYAITWPATQHVRNRETIEIHFATNFFGYSDAIFWVESEPGERIEVGEYSPLRFGLSDLGESYLRDRERMRIIQIERDKNGDVSRLIAEIHYVPFGDGPTRARITFRK